MPRREWRLRIEDILVALENIREFTQGITLDRFREDSRTAAAVLYNLAIIGEAANHVPLIAIGPISRGVVLVVWTERDEDTIRIISARCAAT